MNLFDVSLKVKGYDIAFAKAELARIQSIPEDQYVSYIEQQKQSIVTYHKMYNPFYNEFTSKQENPSWEAVPVLTKGDLQQPLQNRLSAKYSLKNVYINKTSGSSGHPFIFAKDKETHALSWAVIQNRFGWYNLDFNTSLQARFYGIPLDFVGYRKERVKDWLGNRFRFPIFDLTDTKLQYILKKFKNKKFDYINGYTSSIVLFAKYLKQQNLVLKTICPTLKACVTTSEMLFESDKILLETQFGVPIINEYGASELDIIAFQNPEGDFQVNSESIYVEILDKNNRPVPNGETGRIVITSLYNKAHPFIKYDIGDMGALSPRSTPKKPILEKLVGRTNDIAILPSGKVVPGLTFYYVTKSVIQNNGNIKEFVIEQTRPDHFDIKYVAVDMLSEKQEKEIQKELARYLEPKLEISFNKFEVLKRQKSGKLKQFIGLPQ